MVKASNNPSTGTDRYKTIQESNIVTGKRQRQVEDPEKIQQLNEWEIKNAEIKRIAKEKREFDKLNPKPKPQPYHGVAIPTRWDDMVVAKAIAEMEEDAGRKLTAAEKRQIRKDFKE